VNLVAGKIQLATRRSGRCIVACPIEAWRSLSRPRLKSLPNATHCEADRGADSSPDMKSKNAHTIHRDLLLRRDKMNPGDENER
jgi:hypothetical protein